MMARGSDDSRIHAEGIVKAACINAAASLAAAGKIAVSSGADSNTIKAVALYAMEMWNLLEKPDSWPR
jgi:hypothetical protein